MFSRKILALLFVSTTFSATFELSGTMAQAEDNGNSDFILVSSKKAKHHKETSSDNGKQKAEGSRFSGNVSWYGQQFNGKKTSSGKIFDMNKLTCAHRSLPFGTKILVENPRTGQSVIVEVIDRGPFVHSRVMDLSREAARRLGILLGGIAYVNCLVISNTNEIAHESN